MRLIDILIPSTVRSKAARKRRVCPIRQALYSNVAQNSPRECVRLLVLVVIIGLWFGWVVRRARDQREAVAAIERVGGSVQFGANWYNDIILKIRKPWAARGP